jgi:predicted metal-dependent peptidase
MTMTRKPKNKTDPATESFQQAVKLLKEAPMFRPMLDQVHIMRHEKSDCPSAGWATVTKRGVISVHPTRRAQPEEWVYVLAHCLLHLGFGHHQKRELFPQWNAACDCFIFDFLSHLRLGRPLPSMPEDLSFSVKSEEALYLQFCESGIPLEVQNLGAAGPGVCDMRQPPETHKYWYRDPPDWPKLFSLGVSKAVSDVVKQAANIQIDNSGTKEELTQPQKARRWFISNYPLLGALAAGFTLIEDRTICARMEIRVAAVNPEMQEIYFNPASGLDEQECRFVLAHELLHVSLCHQARCRGRDPFLWNVACDYVINHWLMDMGVGEMPGFGGLYDADLKGLSAESVYDRIVTDMRRYRKLATLRGAGLGDMLQGSRPDWWAVGRGVDLDEFYRRCLAQGLEYHEAESRGHLPAGLIEEIRALAQPPIPWDVELARWFDDHFSPIEKRHTYARPSRRQSITPDIPRPRWAPAFGAEDGRTYGVILDTSGSMDRNLLARALGTIASYSMARDVPLVRVVFCDADYYDQGYMAPEAIAGRVKIRGRGGTVLQPAVDLLEKSEDFPKNGPILVITDGYCDRLRIRREHAFVIPRGNHLPFAPRGKVFHIE